MNKRSAMSRDEGPQPYRVSANEYMRMIDAGLFQDSHVELVDGVLIEMAPSKTKHAEFLLEIGRLLGNVYAGTGIRRFGDIITRFDVGNVHAPDIAAVDRDIGEREYLVPEDILLAVEISDATLTDDLGQKRIGYATAGIRHYWVVDTSSCRVHCYADPQGVDYAAIQVIAFSDPIPVPGTEGSITIA